MPASLLVMTRLITVHSSNLPERDDTPDNAGVPALLSTRPQFGCLRPAQFHTSSWDRHRGTTSTFHTTDRSARSSLPYQRRTSGHVAQAHGSSTSGDPPDHSHRVARGSNQFQCSGVCKRQRSAGAIISTFNPFTGRRGSATETRSLHA